MSCKTIRMADGTAVLANVRPGAKLTARDRQTIAGWVQFCRDRKVAREVKEQRERNRRAR